MVKHRTNPKELDRHVPNLSQNSKYFDEPMKQEVNVRFRSTISPKTFNLSNSGYKGNDERYDLARGNLAMACSI